MANLDKAIEAAKVAASGSGTPLANWQAQTVRSLEGNLPKCLVDAGLKLPETVKGIFGVRIDGKYQEVTAEVPVDSLVLAWGTVKAQLESTPQVRVVICVQGAGDMWATTPIRLGRRGDFYPATKMADLRNPNAPQPPTLPKEFVNLLGQMAAESISQVPTETVADTTTVAIDFVPVTF